MFTGLLWINSRTHQKKIFFNIFHIEFTLIVFYSFFIHVFWYSLCNMYATKLVYWLDSVCLGQMSYDLRFWNHTLTLTSTFSDLYICILFISSLCEAHYVLYAPWKKCDLPAPAKVRHGISAMSHFWWRRFCLYIIFFTVITLSTCTILHSIFVVNDQM